MGQYQGEKVGVAAEVQGEATLTHADGSTEIIQKGTLIYEDDTIETSQHGAVNITFNDDTVFAISNNASMVIDEYVYDANKDGEGDIDISVARGVFAYTSGFIGHEDPQDVNIETPVGSIGIRGTTFTASIPAENSGEEFKVSILEGAIAVKPKSGGEFILDDPRESLEINPVTFEVTELGVITPDQVMKSFNVIQTVAPQLLAPVVNAPVQQGKPSNAQGNEKAGEDVPNGPNEAEQTQDADQSQPDANAAGNTADVIEGAAEDANQNSEDSPEQNTIEESEGPLETQGPLDGPILSDNLQPLQTLAPEGPLIVNNIATTTSQIIMNTNNNTTFNPSTSGGSATTSTNSAPHATSDTYIAFEQAGIEGQTHSFNISKFFHDPDGDPLSFTITSVTPGILTTVPPATINGGNIYFTVADGLGADATLSFTVTASDGQLTATKNFQTQIYTDVPFGSETTGDDTMNITGVGGYRFSALTGNDDIDVFSPNNYIFGGLGDDDFGVSGNNNRIYGEAGNDMINLLSGGGNLLSGGAGQDTITVAGSGFGDFSIFGGDGQDLISLDANALAAFSAGTNVIDGGRAADKINFTQGGLINLSALNEGALTSIEKMDISNGSTNILKIDVADILTYNSYRALFVAVDGNDNIQLLNAGSVGVLTPEQTNVSNPYDTNDAGSYSLYSFTNAAGDTASLYVNVDGAGSGGSVSGL